ncbi:MAG: trigger factor [Oscillospiraceae bacterium]|nr:trigger factor [Oscillospiraceae bacterium]
MVLKSATMTETPNRLELEVEIDAAAFEAAVAKTYRKNIGKMNIPGFRRGKASRPYVERIFGADVFYEDATNDLYPGAMDEAIKESGYEYIEDKVDLDVVSIGKEGLVFKAVITVKPEVDVGEYRGLKAVKPSAEPTEEQIGDELEKLRERGSRLVSVDRAAEEQDTVIFDFEGFAGGVAFEGGKGDNHSLILGSGQFIPGFEQQMVGHKPEEPFEVNVTFPEDYHAEELAGKEAVFKCLIHEIKQKELPELNDDFAKDCSEFDTLEELKADLREKSGQKLAEESDRRFESELTDRLAELVSGEIPEAMYENNITNAAHDFEHRLQAQGLELETYLQYMGLDKETFRGNLRPQAEKSVKVRLALEKIVKLEHIDVTEEMLEAEYVKLAGQYGLDEEKIKTLISDEDLKKDTAVEKAMALVKEAAEALDPPADEQPAE